jgi:two-component system sensor histidine kinase SenX3
MFCGCVVDCRAMPASRLSFRLLLPIGLILLVVALGALQYRWLGQVSQAERAQLQRSLNERAMEFARDFDAEIGFAYARLGLTREALEADAWTALDAKYEAWKTAGAPHPDLVKALYITRDAEGGTPRTLHRLVLGTGTGEPVEWPGQLMPVLRNLDRVPSRPVEPPGTRQILSLSRSSVVESVPALIIPVPAPPQRISGPGDFLVQLQTPSTAAVIVELDRDVLIKKTLPELVERHFPDRDASQYHIAIRGNGPEPLYARGVKDPASITAANADAMAPFFSTPHTEMASRAFAEGQVMTWQFNTATVRRTLEAAAVASARETGAGAVREGVAVTTRAVPVPPGNMSIVVRDGVKTGESVMFAALGGWHIALRHGAGSLDAAVAQARRRNLLISFSILSILALGVGIVVVNARRSEKLAAQQMDFVATVSHELRTPLAVIRSAAQNLAAGVIDDPAKAKRYGDLIENEGRRLTDMVEEVLEFAGLSGQRRALALKHVDAVSLVQDVVQSAGPLIASAQVQADVTVEGDVPLLLGDEDALRRAISNLLTNALKHGADGRWVGLSVTRHTPDGPGGRPGDEVRIAVSDRGRGIDAADLPHLFEPFYRGQHAADRQIQGNGLGLSLVQRIAEAHGGRVTVSSAPGQGATFTLHLPVAADADPVASDAAGV